MMKRNYIGAAHEAFLECARGLFDILRAGAVTLEESSPESDARNLEADLHRIGADFRVVFSRIEARDLE